MDVEGKVGRIGNEPKNLLCVLLNLSRPLLLCDGLLQSKRNGKSLIPSFWRKKILSISQKKIALFMP